MKQFVTPPVIIRALIGVIVALSIVASGVGVAVVHGLRDRAAADERSTVTDAPSTNPDSASRSTAPGASDTARPEAAPSPQGPPSPPAAGETTPAPVPVPLPVPAPVVPPLGTPSAPEDLVVLPRARDAEQTSTQDASAPARDHAADRGSADGPASSGVTSRAASPIVPVQPVQPVQPMQPMQPVQQSTQQGTVPVTPTDKGGRIAVGISTDGVPTAARIDEYRRATGAPPAIVGWFLSWGDPFGWRDQLDVVSDTGAIPMIAIDPARGSDTVPLRDIASGAYDDYITSLAVQAREHADPLLFRFGHEMNLPSIEWQMKSNTPEDFVNAWRHMVEIFRAEHADNVRWVWSPNADCMGSCPFTDYYPGDAYVDWVGIDVYNFAEAHGTPWHSLSDLLTSSYRSLTRLTDKPMMLSEIASVEEGGDKAAWIRTALSDIPKKFPAVQAIVWWDRHDGAGQDYRFDSSPSAKEAFLQQLHSDSYGSTLSPDGR